ncbi:MAG: polysaccharide deacetylase family protein [Clostridia bacterium]|nr:polysaccharide deacetylase family protein [Clostridia bacterium]
MKKLSSRAIAAVTNGILAIILIVVGTVCFFPTTAGVSGIEDKAIYKGNSEDGVSLMINVYWGTEQVYGMLDVLDEYEAKATFFIGGSWADDNVACLKEIKERGHEIGTHGYFHRDHDKLSYDENIEELRRSIEFLSLAADIPVTLFAPPSGAYNDDTLNAAENMGLKTILWSKDTIDWRDKDENLCYRRATENVGGGELILMHPMAHTLAALPRILEYYKTHSLRPVTVSENLG